MSKPAGIADPENGPQSNGAHIKAAHRVRLGVLRVRARPVYVIQEEGVS